MFGVPAAVAGAMAHEQVHAEAATDSEKRQERRERHADRDQCTEDDCGAAQDPCPAWERENDPERRSAGAPLPSARDTVRGRRSSGVRVAAGSDRMGLLANVGGHGREISFVLLTGSSPVPDSAGRLPARAPVAGEDDRHGHDEVSEACGSVDLKRVASDEERQQRHGRAEEVRHPGLGNAWPRGATGGQRGRRGWRGASMNGVGVRTGTAQRW